MFVAKRMTPGPTTVSPSITVAEATEVLRNRKVKRLPVVEGGKLVGIVTDRDLREASPSQGTSLDKFELNYLLSKVTVRDVMRKNVITIDVNAAIEEAALLMYKNKIGGLVVINSGGDIVGIITETDIFKSFVDVMGLKEGKTRFTFIADDQVGVVHDITQVYKDMGLNIGSLVSYNTDAGKFELVICADVKDVKALTERLAAVGFAPRHVVQIG
jgi:acetoin utilization protein AcuB